mgnify:CR=1 FL=1
MCHDSIVTNEVLCGRVECRKPYPARGNRRFCSNVCAARDYKKTHGLTVPPETRNTNHRGLLSELLVMADLVQRGLDVYRAMSGHAPGDLAVMLNGRLVLVEVRTGVQPKDKIIVPWTHHDRHAHKNVLAVVVRNQGNRIQYLDASSSDRPVAMLTWIWTPPPQNASIPQNSPQSPQFYPNGGHFPTNPHG